MSKRWYQFHQNNSGGSFIKEMGNNVYVLAENAQFANLLAESVGIYFDGCEKGVDCRCCGDRWSAAWSDEGDDLPTPGDYYAENIRYVVELGHLLKQLPKDIAA